MKKSIIISAVALFSSVASAGVVDQALAQYDKDETSCKTAIDKTLSITAQTAAQFACAAAAGDARDDTIYGHALRQALATNKVSAADLDALFAKSSIRAALIKDGRIVAISAFTPAGVDDSMIVAGGNHRIVNPGYNAHYRIIHVSDNAGRTLAGIVPRDSGAESAARYARLADDETKRAAAKAAKAAK